MEQKLNFPTTPKWVTEPNTDVWTYREHSCVAIRNMLSGTWRGYVSVPKDHEAYGLYYDKLTFHVHGGITFADSSLPPDSPVQCENVWWIGFDCGHGFDLYPYLDDKYLPLFAEVGAEYRDLEYVKQECNHLVDQLHGEYTIGL